MLSFLKTRLAAKIALTMAIPVVVNLLLYGEMQRQLVSLERLTDELAVRRNIVQHTNDIVIANYFAIQSLMQFKMFNKPSVARPTRSISLSIARSLIRSLSCSMAVLPIEK